MIKTKKKAVRKTISHSVISYKLDEIKHVDLKLVWDPPWTKDKMSKAAKLELNL